MIFNNILDCSYLLFVQCMEQNYLDKPQNELQPVTKPKVNNKVSSEFFEEYHKYFEDVADMPSKEQTIFELSKKFDGKYDEMNQRRPFQIKVLSHTYNYQILECKVNLMYFTMVIHIYNQKGKSKTHIFENISTTAIGIYSAFFQNKNIVIKCLPISQMNFQERLIKAIQQYCLLKIASLLKIGPSLDKIFGFDLILYEYCIEFAMEYCLPIQQWSNKHTLELKKKLFSLHQIHITHLDIKPENIRFSPSLKQYIFIDYGFSLVAFEDIGEKTLTPFVGTLGYCSHEMRKGYYQKNSFVDLYYNDVHCLKLSIQVIQGFDFNKDGKEREVLYVDSKELLQRNIVLEQLLVISLKSVMYKQILDGQQHVNIFLKYPEVFKQFFKTLPFSWRNERFQFVYLLSQSDRKDFQKSRPKKYLFFTMDKENNKYAIQNESDNVSKVNRLIQGISSADISSQSYFFLEQNNLKDFLINPVLINKMNKLQYFSFYLKFVDRCSNLSTFLQKTTVSKVMVELESLDSLFVTKEISPMEQCLLHVLRYFLNSNRIHYLSFVPTLLANLFIFQTLSEQEIIHIYQSISVMPLDPIFHAKLLFNCFVVKEWIVQRAITKYKFTSVVSRIEGVISCSFQRLISKNPIPILLFISRLLPHDINHSQLTQIETLSEQLKVLSQDIDQKFAIELNLYLNIIKLKYISLIDVTSYGTNFQKCNFLFERLYVYLRKHYHQRIDIDYITLRLLVFCCEKNISEAALNYYAKIEKYLENKELMSKFKFHYAIKYNSFCNFQLSFDEIISCFMENIESDCFLYDQQILMKFIKLFNHSWFHFLVTFKGNQEHIQYFTKTFSIEKFTKMRPPTTQSCSSFQHNICKYFRLHFLFILSTEYLPSFASIIAQGRKKFEVLKDLIDKTNCLKCQADCQHYIELIDAHLQYGQGKFKGSVEKYFIVLEKMLDSKIKNTTMIIEIQEITFKIIKITYKTCMNDKQYQYDCWQKVITWINNYGLCWITIAPHFEEEYFSFLCIFSLVIEENHFQFFCFHIKIIEFLSHFHSTPILTFFNRIIIEFCNTFPQHMQMFNDAVLAHILQMIPDSHFQFKYLGLLFSACLRLQQRIGIFNRTLRFICQKIKFAHHQAKNMTLGNIYYYKLRCISSSQNFGAIKLLRQRAKLFKSYCKVDIFRLSLKQFIAGFLIKPLRKSKNKFEKKMKACIIRYYQNMNKENQKIILRLAYNYMYENPLNNLN